MKFNVNKCVCTQLENLKRLFFLSLYIWFYSILSSPVIHPGYKKTIYVSEFSLIKFSPLSREPFKEERVILEAVGSQLLEKSWFYRSRPPPGAPPSGQFPTTPGRAPHHPPLVPPPPWQFRRPQRSGTRQSPNWEADLWSIVSKLLSPSPSSAHCKGLGSRAEQGEGKIYRVPLLPALSAFRFNCTFYYFNSSP